MAILYTIVMKYSFYSKLINKLLRAFQLQLYLTLMSAPILIYWGLPLSLASPIGNILFHPLLTLFLLCASLIFFCELLHIPYNYLLALFEKISDAFHYFVGFGTQDFLVGFARPPLFILLLIPITVVASLMWKKTRPLKRNIFALLALSFFWGISVRYCTHKPSVVYIACNKGVVYLVQSQDILTLIDPGILGQRASAPSFVEFTLVPEIIRVMGISKINNVLVLKPSSGTFQALAKLAECCQIDTIFIPYWQGNMNKGQARAYRLLCEAVRRNAIHVIRLKNFYRLTMGSSLLTIQALPQTIRSHDMLCPGYQISGSVDGYKIDVYSSKKRVPKIWSSRKVLQK